ncbi:hypothetical protein THAOC_24431, partial [Thalassiosira oceanica]
MDAPEISTARNPSKTGAREAESTLTAGSTEQRASLAPPSASHFQTNNND